ncbi:18072_t:CDS:1, partial [Gigaspora rosea]
MTVIIESLRKTLEALAIHDEDTIEDFFSNADDSVPESFRQIFGFAFSEEDINYAIEQLQNEKASFNGTNSEFTSNENERKYTMLPDVFLLLLKVR